MGLACISSAAFVGLDALFVQVEVDTKPRLVEDSGPVISIVGLPDASVKEAKERVLTGIKNSNLLSGGALSITVNLAPGHLRKEGPLYDLPIAVGVLCAEKLIPSNLLEDYLIVGELGLSGEIRPIFGSLAVAILARQQGKRGVLLPAANAKEAATVPGIEVIAVNHLSDVVSLLRSPDTIQPINISLDKNIFALVPPTIDFVDIKGQDHVKRAMEVAAAGCHNIILCGPPGSGKTMLAKALPGIIPELTIDEALEVTKIHSIAGLLKAEESLVTRRPFRSPHHTVSYAGLIGGGSNPRPGEVSLAHQGILFLDELPEFSRPVLEVLRQPLEDREVTISRANGRFTFPTGFLCVAAMNPCPCGNLGHPDKACSCSTLQIQRYRSKISGPLLDRIDMHIEVPALRYRDMLDKSQGETSQNVRSRVKQARVQQQNRLGNARTNAQMSRKELKNFVALDASCEQLMQHAIDTIGISARAHDRILKVARTIADLSLEQQVSREHLMEAISYRDQNFLAPV